MSSLTPIGNLEKITFATCKLDREKYADVLTDIVRTNTNGLVLAIDNKWGTGKTTFVNMWRNKLQENDAYKTLYFNAWENDFENNPFVAITAELKELLGEEDSKTFKAVLEKGSKIAKAAIPSIVKALVKRHGGEDLAEILEKTSEGVLEAFEKDIEAYVERKQNIKDFHKKLEEYIAENSIGKPIIFIIDELDRCRPDYAVSVLENIKHLFSVKGIVFVLSIDKEQLGHAVCGVYGSDNIDSNEYLRRFIDVEYSLPKPALKSYVAYLIEVHKLNEFFSLNPRKDNKFRNEKDKFIKFSTFIFDLKHITLRQQEKIIRHAGITLRSFNYNEFVIPELLVYLIYLRSFYGEIYLQIKNRELNHQELLNKLESTLKGKLVTNSNESYMRIQIEVFMLLFYNEYLENNERLEILKNFKEEDDLNINSNFDNSKNQTSFKHFISQEKYNYDTGGTAINYLLTKIDLMEPLKDL